MKPALKALNLRYLARAVRRVLPRSLWARVLLIIVLPVAIMQFMVTWVFFNMHWETVTARLSEGLAGDVAWAVSTYEATPTPETLTAISEQAQKSMQLSIVLQKGRGLPESERKNLFAPLDRTMDQALGQALDASYWFDTTRYPAVVDIRVSVPGGVLRIIAPKDRAFATTGHIFLLWMVVATGFLTFVSMGFIRNQVRAIERLSKAAEAFGRGEEVTDFKPYGAREVRSAAESFLKMKARIQRHLEQRTTLLASVSHDLRTPLTRLKLELAMAAQDEATARMKQDVSEMAYMIDEYLAFARGEMQADTDSVSVRALMETLEENARRAGHMLDIHLLDQDLRIQVREVSLQRALTNLIMNGFHYGKHVSFSAEVDTASPQQHRLRFYVDDDGPGIPADKYEDAFKPFSRLDESRNQNIKGVGLGLAIARDTVRSHGGELMLDQSPMGGLRAIISLPLKST